MSANASAPVQQLVQVALGVRQRAYAPYSRFLVGAAVFSLEGGVFEGCNFENASYGLCICAERNAVGSMIAAGHKQIAAVVVATSGGGSPCGACRQVMAEFGEGFPVYIVDADSGQVIDEMTIDELLPRGFKLQR